MQGGVCARRQKVHVAVSVIWEQKKEGRKSHAGTRRFFPLSSLALVWGVVKARLSSFAFTVFGKAVQLLRTPYSVVALLVPCICPHTRILQLTTFGTSHQFCLPRPKLRSPSLSTMSEKTRRLGTGGSRKAARRLHEAGRSHISHLRTLDLPQSPFFSLRATECYQQIWALFAFPFDLWRCCP